MVIKVLVDSSGSTHATIRLSAGGGCSLSVPAVLGRAGVVIAAHKREGDGATPLGEWRLRRVYYRPDRVAPPASRFRPVCPLAPDMGWCDAPDHPAYNQLIRFPFAASAERLWRADRVYDYLGVLSHNQVPTIAGAGSAIFLHLAQPDRRPTEGCVAVSPAVFEALLRAAEPSERIVIAFETPGRGADASATESI